MMNIRGLTALCALIVCVVLWACAGAWKSPQPARLVPHPSSWSADALNITYVGHASVLIGLQGTMILTDPSFFAMASVSEPEPAEKPVVSLSRTSCALRRRFSGEKKH